mmetsp:Transcript_16312/g.23750  ORF Transcript_16312/g.23750 Transcript_16312/m.23750 type:complete len:356 (-) Transcript_16312:34-1101(-)
MRPALHFAVAGGATVHHGVHVADDARLHHHHHGAAEEGRAGAPAEEAHVAGSGHHHRGHDAGGQHVVLRGPGGGVWRRLQGPPRGHPAGAGGLLGAGRAIRVRGEGHGRGQRAAAGGDRLRGALGHAPDAAAGVPAGLRAAGGGRGALRGPLGRAGHGAALGVPAAPGAALRAVRDRIQLHGRVRHLLPVRHLARHHGQLPPRHHLGLRPADLLRVAAAPRVRGGLGAGQLAAARRPAGALPRHGGLQRIGVRVQRRGARAGGTAAQGRPRDPGGMDQDPGGHGLALPHEVASDASPGKGRPRPGDAPGPGTLLLAGHVQRRIGTRSIVSFSNCCMYPRITCLFSPLAGVFLIEI